jgi:hypothetical protein
MSYTATIPGTYTVHVTDPVCGDVTSNAIEVHNFEAVLGGPPCVCFGKAYDLTIKTNWCIDGQYSMEIDKNGVQIFSGNLQSNNEIITIPGIVINNGDVFTGNINGPCGMYHIGTFKPSGCDCHQKK